MFILTAKVREITGKKVKVLRRQGSLPAILYGPSMENKALVLDVKEFEKIYQEAGESSIIKLKVQSPKSKVEEISVLIKEAVKHPVTEKFLHVDFYQPRAGEKIEVTIPLVFEGQALAVKELGGVLIKNISEIEIKALPQDLPKEIRVNVSGLKALEDVIQIKDLVIPAGVEVLKEPEEVVAMVSLPEEIEEEKPAEEAPLEQEKPTEEKEGKKEEGKAKSKEQS